MNASFLPRPAGRQKEAPYLPANGGGPLADSSEDSSNALYSEFCRQLQRLLESAGCMKPAEIGDALGIVPSQAAKWLQQAKQDGQIFQASKKPVRFGLPGKSLL